jgi:hypothetical protein
VAPDNVRLDPASGQLFVGYGSGGLAALDPVLRSVVSRTELPAHPEGFQLEPIARRAFVNVPDVRQIAIVDLETRTQVASWGSLHESALNVRHLGRSMNGLRAGMSAAPLMAAARVAADVTSLT